MEVYFLRMQVRHPDWRCGLMPTRYSVVKVLSTLVLCHPLVYSPPLHAHSCPLPRLASSLCEEEIEESRWNKNCLCSYFISKNLVERPHVTTKEAGQWRQLVSHVPGYEPITVEKTRMGLEKQWAILASVTKPSQYPMRAHHLGEDRK